MVSMHNLNAWSMSLVTIPIPFVDRGKGDPRKFAILWVSLGSVVRAMPKTNVQPVANNVGQPDVNVSSQV